MCHVCLQCLFVCLKTCSHRFRRVPTEPAPEPRAISQYTQRALHSDYVAKIFVDLVDAAPTGSGGGLHRDGWRRDVASRGASVVLSRFGCLDCLLMPCRSFPNLRLVRLDVRRSGVRRVLLHRRLQALKRVGRHGPLPSTRCVLQEKHGCVKRRRPHAIMSHVLCAIAEPVI